MTARVIGGGYEEEGFDQEEREQKNEGNGIRKRDGRASLGEETYRYTASKRSERVAVRGGASQLRPPPESIPTVPFSPPVKRVSLSRSALPSRSLGSQSGRNPDFGKLSAPLSPSV